MNSLTESRHKAEEQLSRIAAELTAVRRHLHQHPELSGQEYATTAYLGEKLAQAGIPYRAGPAGLGLLADCPPSEGLTAPFIAIRADIDALPITEENEVPYRSGTPGVMHACGHDAHSAMVLGALLALHRTGAAPVGWRGIFQSSEETGHGALDMVQAGAVKDISAILALHVDPNLPAGWVAVSPGPQTSCCQDFQIEIHGRGGHAARPHLTVDPIAISAHLITAIYQAIPRQTDTRKPVVVSITQIAGGHCSNVIPDSAQLGGTIRTLEVEISEQTRQRVEALCAGIGQSFGADIRPTFGRLLRGVVNDPAVTARCTEAAWEIAGRERTITENTPSLGAEDFADYLTEVPGCMMRVGIRREGEKITPLHTPTFDLDETTLLLGARLLVRSAFKVGEIFA